MLVLSRQRDETIMIGDDIEITVVDIRGDKVRLGINAPKEVSVHRKEVYDAIRRENRAAAQVKPEDVAGLKDATGRDRNNDGKRWMDFKVGEVAGWEHLVEGMTIGKKYTNPEGTFIDFPTATFKMSPTDASKWERIE